MKFPQPNKILYDWFMKNLTVLALLALLFTFCNESKEQASNKKEESASAGRTQKEMIVYGSNECEHCITFKRQMDSLNIRYTFYDVQVDQSKADEMLKKLERVNFIGYISFPVVDIEGNIMVAPELKKVIAAVQTK